MSLTIRSKINEQKNAQNSTFITPFSCTYKENYSKINKETKKLQKKSATHDWTILSKNKSAANDAGTCLNIYFAGDLESTR